MVEAKMSRDHTEKRRPVGVAKIGDMDAKKKNSGHIIVPVV